ncbi:HNH endonuclease [Candidatus Binatus sp.]|uniref:HNH endonuclease n=1 Tax=Candidatus Binatus sp. TaxID=2811406 RepID=UPI002F935FAD
MTTHLKCLYCENPLDGSGEHVILSALGGKKQTHNACCNPCNNRLGTEIDKPFADSLQVFSNQVGITTGRGKPAPTLRKLDSGLGYEVNLRGQKPEVAKASVKTETLPNGQIRVNIQARNEEEARRLLAAQLERFKGKGEIGAVTAESVSQYLPQMRFSLKLGGSLGLRSVAKMMLNYLCINVRPDQVRLGVSAEIIKFISAGERPPEPWVDFDHRCVFPATPNPQPFQHRLFVFASPNRGLVFGLLELFGALRFSGLLAETWSGPEINRAYVIDPITNEAFDATVVPPAEIGREYFATRRFDLGVASKQLQAFFSTLGDLQRRQNLNEMIESSYHSQMPGEGEVITNDHIQKLARDLAGRFVVSLYRIDSREPLDPTTLMPSPEEDKK